MQSKLNPYINFNGTTRDAMEFYKSVFGGTLEISSFKENGLDAQFPDEGDKIMHAMLEADNGITFMAADTPSSMPYNPGTNISLSLSGFDTAELSGYFEKLSTGGTIVEPLTEAPWGDTFGMLTDQFGINWMVNIGKAKDQE